MSRIWSLADHYISAYEGGGFPITKEGRLKFGFRARKVCKKLGLP